MQGGVSTGCGCPTSHITGAKAESDCGLRPASVCLLNFQLVLQLTLGSPCALVGCWVSRQVLSGLAVTALVPGQCSSPRALGTVQCMHTWLHDQQWHLGTPTELMEGRNIRVVYSSFLRGPWLPVRRRGDDGDNHGGAHAVFSLCVCGQTCCMSRANHSRAKPFK